jgi:hypothetical protein
MKPSLFDDVTVVTGYVNIGSFQKGSQKQYTPELYHTWMAVFGTMQNPVVAYFDNKTEAVRFESLRAKGGLINKTSIVIFERNFTWSFGLLPKIKEIISKPGYPKHHPNTVVPEYQSIQHLKYEVMQNVTSLNPFNTKYFAWTDIGLFRHMTSQSSIEIKPFHIYIPEGYDPSKIAYNQVTESRPLTDQEIFLLNLYWVCGCFFIGEINTMKAWVREYMQYTEMFLAKGLANTDQRVVYAMQTNHAPGVKVQAYVPRSIHNIWFDLAYACKDQGRIKFGAN